MNCLVAFSGATKSGKTTLATQVAKRLQCPVASFGGFVRKIAYQKGLPNPTRHQLQEIGDRLAAADMLGFCQAVFDDVGFEHGSPLVIDGIRHLEALSAIQELAPNQTLKLIYVESDLPSRARRAGLSEDEMGMLDSHPVESQSAKLRSASDLIVNGLDSPESSLAQVLHLLNSEE
jgi:hypothetical protein